MGVRIAFIVALLLTGCENVGIAPNPAGAGAAARGRVAAERLGCGACHVMPGIWPAGTSGPSLENFRDRAVIAGRYANRPDRLAEFLLHPSETAMPRQPMSARDAADIAAFLHSAPQSANAR
ncbi:MAG: c-type cytochrome [Novosphingobium sp.]|nr:MAG: c-type cytochrome [Novosphingobium sp.]